MKNPSLHRYATRPGLYFTDDGGADAIVRSETADQVWFCVLEPLDQPSAFYADAVRLFNEPGLTFIDQAMKQRICTRRIPSLNLRETLFRMDGPNYGLWYVHVPQAWDGMQYGYRVNGPWDPDHGVSFNPYKLLLDPYAKGIEGSMELDPGAFSYECEIVNGKVKGSPFGPMSTIDSVGHVPVSVAIDDRATNKHDGEPSHPHVAWSKTVIYELHVKGFTANAPWLPKELRGTYAGLAHPATLSYLQDLGVTSIELLPIQAKQSELFLQERGRVNYWGYSTLGYFAPEASYATKRSQETGAAAVRQEVIDMVRALHEAGFEVIMDVVYNHMFSPDNWFERIVPEYFLRRKPNGALSNGSGCGCDMATERAMFRRFVVESVAYWAREYHLDGFRFDLMGLIDVDTMNAVRAALDEIPDRGPSILMYGEPWSASATAALPGTVLADKAGLPQLDNRIGHFCDTTRDAIKGHVFFSDRPGYVNGGMHENAASVRDAVNAWRASKQPEGVAGQVIQYVSAHDDLTLWDKLCASLAAKSLGSAVSEGDNENSVDVPKALYDADLSEAGLASAGSAIAGAMATVMDANRMAAGIVLTSAGIPFMLSGEEFARTKYGNSDSYDSARELNWLDWTRAWRMRDLVEYYTKLIALRKSSAEWFDGDRVIVSVEGDELVFRVGDYLVAVNPGRHIGAIDVASTAVAPVSESSRVWCGMGSSANASAACISAGDGDYLIVPPHTFAIWRLR